MTPIIETQRLVLKPLSLSHLSNDYVAWMNDPDVNKYLESGGDYNLQKLDDFLKEVEQKEIFFWAIHIKEKDRHIGNIKIDPINNRHLFAEYGIMMGDKTEWGKGYAFEASMAVIDYCFSENLNLIKINLGVQFKNQNAIKLYQKIGFEIERRLINHVITTEGYDDILRMVIYNPKNN